MIKIILFFFGLIMGLKAEPFTIRWEGSADSFEVYKETDTQVLIGSTSENFLKVDIETSDKIFVVAVQNGQKSKSSTSLVSEILYKRYFLVESSENVKDWKEFFLVPIDQPIKFFRGKTIEMKLNP